LLSKLTAFQIGSWNFKTLTAVQLSLVKTTMFPLGLRVVEATLRQGLAFASSKACLIQSQLWRELIAGLSADVFLRIVKVLDFLESVFG
jgi:hypothetical protein